MPDFNVQQALSRTYYEALVRYHEGGLANGGGIAGLQRPQLDRFDSDGTTVIKSTEPAAQPQPGDQVDPHSVTTWLPDASGKPKPHYTAPQQDPVLNSFLQTLADKLAVLPGQSYMVPGYLSSQIDPNEVASVEKAFAAENYPSDISQESAQLQAARTQIRHEIAQAAAGNVSRNPAGFLQTALNMIQDDQVKADVQQALTDSQNDQDGGQSQFFRAPSSSSGMFHPADEINTGGLALHSLRDVEMGDRLCQIFGVTGLQRDEVLGALAVHDIEKGGAPWKDYAGDHGPIGERYLEHIWHVDQDTPDDPAHREKYMATMVGRHMAQWNTGAPAPGKKYGPKDPLVPQNLGQQLVSWGDYLGALDNVYVDAPST